MGVTLRNAFELVGSSSFQMLAKVYLVFAR